MNSQERIFEIVQHLHKNHVYGLANKELAKLVGTSEVNICRDLGIFEHYQWACRAGKDGRWRLSPAFAGIAGEIMKSYREAKLLLGKEEERYASAMQ
jgi:DNA-binding IclR family transcriptional regulator